MTSEEKKAKFKSLPFNEQREMVVEFLIEQFAQCIAWGVSHAVMIAAVRSYAVTTWMNEPTAPATFRALADELEKEQAKRKQQKPN